MKTYRICWSRIDHVLEREDYYHVIVPARNKVAALAAVRKYFTLERAKEKIRYGHYILSMDVEIGKGNRKNEYWRPLNFANTYVADYRISPLVADIRGLVVPGLPDDKLMPESEYLV